MKQFFGAVCAASILLTAACSSGGQSENVMTGGNWELASAQSSVNYISTKNGDISEDNSFWMLDGEVTADGKATVRIFLDSVDTQIDIRDQRMRKHVFNTADHPVANITSDLKAAAGDGLPIGETRVIIDAVTVEMNGQSKTYSASFSVTPLSEARVQVSSKTPIVVQADDFGLGGGVETLRGIANLDAISPEVPVTFDLIFRRAD